MPYSPTLSQGALGNPGAWNVIELGETGVLIDNVKLAPVQEKIDTKAHVSADALNQIVRTRTDTSALMIEFTGSVIADSNGLLAGLAKTFGGQNIAACAHFAQGGRAVFGFTRDDTKLLEMMEPEITISRDPGAFNPKLRYLPYVAHDAAAA